MMAADQYVVVPVVMRDGRIPAVGCAGFVEVGWLEWKRGRCRSGSQDVVRACATRKDGCRPITRVAPDMRLWGRDREYGRASCRARVDNSARCEATCGMGGWFGCFQVGHGSCWRHQAEVHWWQCQPSEKSPLSPCKPNVISTHQATVMCPVATPSTSCGSMGT